MPTHEMEGTKMAFFPYSPGSGKLSGGIAEGENHKPSMEGTVVYLNADPDLSEALGRVEATGGKVVVPKMSLGENGNIAIITDTEGNNIGIQGAARAKDLPRLPLFTMGDSSPDLVGI
jgi:uncharacterized protein